MIPLYVLLLAGLGCMTWFRTARTLRLERLYARAALQAEQIAQALLVKPWNKTTDAYALAKHQYALGRLVEVRDRLEQRFMKAQRAADRALAWQAQARACKGRLIPYLVGVVDAALVLVGLHFLGLPHGLSAQSMQQWAAQLGR